MPKKAVGYIGWLWAPLRNSMTTLLRIVTPSRMTKAETKSVTRIALAYRHSKPTTSIMTVFALMLLNVPSFYYTAAGSFVQTQNPVSPDGDRALYFDFPNTAIPHLSPV